VIVVIIAGGSGTRLWPLSRPDYPKHLLVLDGEDLSLLQHTYQRAKRLTDKIYIVSEAGHIQHVKDQLPELPELAFIIEPARRGTANCIIAALAHVSKLHDAEEPIAFMHADHFIRDVSGFVYSFRLADRVAREKHGIVLVGVEPDEPETGFGYIEKGDLVDEQRLVFAVNSFKEKPDYQTAKRYLRSGNYLWNGGYFVASLNAFLESMKQHAPELLSNYQNLESAPQDKYEETYLSFESDAIDYALIEKATDLLVVPANFDWMDLGSYADIAKAVNGDERGNYCYGEQIVIDEVKNSFVHNGEAKPVAIIGLDNVAVINTPHGLLVTRKDLSQRVGDAAKRFNAQD
jgi:mannose-1-phosphate guanylyltransferase